MFRSLKLYLGQNIERNDLIKTLLEYNYQSCREVNQEGDYSLRGGIVDIFPATFENPIRLELTANRINSIRSFDVISAQTLDSHKLVIILPRNVFRAGPPRSKFFVAMAACNLERGVPFLLKVILPLFISHMPLWGSRPLFFCEPTTVNCQLNWSGRGDLNS